MKYEIDTKQKTITLKGEATTEELIELLTTLEGYKVAVDEPVIINNPFVQPVPCDPYKPYSPYPTIYGTS